METLTTKKESARKWAKKHRAKFDSILKERQRKYDEGMMQLEDQLCKEFDPIFDAFHEEEKRHLAARKFDK